MPKLTKSRRKASELLDSDQEPDYHKRLDYYDPQNNNNKFWHIWVYGRTVIRRYGRQGAKGQTVVHTASSTWEAREAAVDLYYSKIDKGYEKDETTVLDHIARRMA